MITLQQTFWWNLCIASDQIHCWSSLFNCLTSTSSITSLLSLSHNFCGWWDWFLIIIAPVFISIITRDCPIWITAGRKPFNWYAYTETNDVTRRLFSFPFACRINAQIFEWDLDNVVETWTMDVDCVNGASLPNMRDFTTLFWLLLPPDAIQWENSNSNF